MTSRFTNHQGRIVRSLVLAMICGCLVIPVSPALAAGAYRTRTTRRSARPTRSRSAQPTRRRRTRKTSTNSEARDVVFSIAALAFTAWLLSEMASPSSSSASSRDEEAHRKRINDEWRTWKYGYGRGR